MGKKFEAFIARTQTFWILMVYLLLQFNGSLLHTLVKQNSLGGWGAWLFGAVTVLYVLIFIVFFYSHKRSIVHRSTGSLVIDMGGGVEEVVAPSHHRTVVYGPGYRNEEMDRNKDGAEVGLIGLIFGWTILVALMLMFWYTTVMDWTELRIAIATGFIACYLYWRVRLWLEIRRRNKLKEEIPLETDKPTRPKS